MTDLKLVYIEWHDAHGVEPNWEWMEDLIDKVDHICIAKSVGWLIKENKFQVVIVPHLIEASPLTRAQGCGEMTIPRSSIRRMVSFKLPGAPRKAPARGVGAPRRGQPLGKVAQAWLNKRILQAGGKPLPKPQGRV